MKRETSVTLLHHEPQLKRNFLNRIVILAAILLAARTLYAQPNSISVDSGVVTSSAFGPAVLGVFAGYELNIHRTNALIFSYCPTCGNFTGGDGSGLTLGAFVELPLLRAPISGMSLVGGLEYAQRGGTYGSIQTSDLPILDPTTNKYVTLVRQNSATANLGFLQLDAGMKYQPFESFPIYARATLNVAAPIAASSHQTQQILSPQGVVFPTTHTTLTDVSNGPISGVKIPFGMGAALGYPFPLAVDLTIAPEVQYYLPFTKIVPSQNWSVSALEFGVALRYGGSAPPPSPPQPAPVPPPPPVVEKKPVPKPPIAVLGTISSPHVSILETIVTETFPVLPYLFFDSASDALPARYVSLAPSATRTFSESDLPHRSLEAYYNILNVVGSRMAQDTSYSIVLNGTTDGKETEAGSAAKNLAYDRAERVKDYLTQNWSIDPKRIEITTSVSPTFPSTIEFPEGIAENRRVELSSDNDALLRPILHERFREHVVDPPEIPFTTKTGVPSDIASWEMTASVKAKPVWQTKGTGAPPTEIEWKLDPANTSRVAEALNDADSLHCELKLTSKEGLTSASAIAIPAKKSINPFELSRLSLIVFDFDKSEITPQNQRMIAHFVSHSILDSSKSTIVGSTDNLGEEKHNQSLSEGRAFAVRDLILAERPNTQITKTEGVGSNRQMYPNDVPEGRYYCRTVTVEVETPLSSIKQ